MPNPIANRVAARYLAARYIERLYVILEKPWEHFQGTPANIPFADGFAPMRTTYLRGSQAYQDYLRAIGQSSTTGLSSPSSAYIYSFRTPPRIFELDAKGVARLAAAGALDPAKAEATVPGWTPQSLAAHFLDRPKEWRLHNYAAAHFIEVVRLGPFRRLYDGFRNEKGAVSIYPGREDVYVFADWHDANLEIVDGNYKRNIQESPDPDGYEVPEFVMAALHAFTETPGKKFNATARKWLEKNHRPPYTSRRLYRGLEFVADDLTKGPDGTYISFLQAKALRMLGVPLTEVRRGAAVRLTRGAESSWTAEPRIAAEFATRTDAGVLIKAEVPVSQILVDLTLLPLSQRRELRHFIQNEVILKNGVVAGVVAQFYVDPGNFTKVTLRREGWTVDRQGFRPLPPV